MVMDTVQIGDYVRTMGEAATVVFVEVMASVMAIAIWQEPLAVP
jgi:tRNA G37 N-methylase TrmD